MRPLIALFIFILALPTSAQPHRHLEQTHTLTVYDDRDAWLEQAAWMRDHILISNGLWPMPEKTGLNPVESTLIEEDGYRVQSVTLETYPGFYLTGTLFLPPGDGPFPAILSPHGHWSQGRFEDGERASIPGRALNFAKRGFVVFSYSMIGYNETDDLFPHKFDDPRYQLWGFSAMGLQLWNSIRALDYLASHAAVDENRIGMTGASGGGTQTFLLTAVDDRIKVAAPVNMISAHFQGGCICENAPLLRHALNNVEIGALAAPRPLLMVSTSGDWTANTPSIEFPAIQQVYSLFDGEDRVANAHFDYPHNYNKDSREAVYAWFEKWLGTQSNSDTEAPFTLPASATLPAQLPGQMLSEQALFSQFVSHASTPSPQEGLESIKDTYGIALNHVLHADSLPEVDMLVGFSPSMETASNAVLIVHDSPLGNHEEAQALSDRYVSQGRLTAIFTLDSKENAFNPPDSISYWTTYNPTHTQRQVHEIISAARSLVERQRVDSLDLIGLDGTGPITFLARSQLPFVRTTHVDFGGISFEADDAFLNHANIPLLRRAGGFKTAAALAAPNALTIQNIPDSELKSWIRQLYNELGAGNMLSFE